MPEDKLIIYYKKVKSNDTVCIFANVGVPTTCWSKPSVPLLFEAVTANDVNHHY